jgi:hypothetical protein
MGLLAGRLGSISSSLAAMRKRFGRAGLYAYDFIDNGGQRSAERILLGWMPIMANFNATSARSRCTEFREWEGLRVATPSRSPLASARRPIHLLS